MKRKKKQILAPPPIGIAFLLTTFIDGIQSSKFYGRSLVGNFLQSLYTHWAYNDSADFPASGAPWSSLIKVKVITGSTVNSYNSGIMNVKANPGIVDTGLVFGSGTTAPAPADYVMEGLFIEGSGTDQFLYGNQTAIQGAEINSQITNFILQRICVNSSGAQIDVTEIGLYVDYSAGHVMVFHDVFSPADEVPDGSDYRCTLEVSITT